MDIATIIGVIAGVVLMVWSILIGGDWKIFVNVPSILCTGGGMVAATLICFPLRTVLGVFNVVRKTVLHQDLPLSQTIASLVRYAEKARKEGMLSLEEETESERDEFLKKGLMLAVDGTESELLARILENDMNAVEMRHAVGQNVLVQMGTYAPAFGMVGTLIGLVQMLMNMSDPKMIGPGMAVAILTTFYGAVVANLFCLPMAEKLKLRSADEMQRMQLIVEGIMSIKAGDTPRVVEEKLKSFLSPKDRAGFTREKAS